MSTLKTVIGFCQSWLARRVPLFKSNSSIEGIYNYLEIPGVYPTSGQPSETELATLCSAGYDVVINLAPTSVLENSVVNEAEILAEHGAKYVHLPVDFKNPTDDDFTNFVKTLDEHKDNKIWVHCAANMRVSAFTYRYRVSVLREDESNAKRDLDQIWEPFGVWTEFIQREV